MQEVLSGRATAGMRGLLAADTDADFPGGFPETRSADCWGELQGP